MYSEGGEKVVRGKYGEKMEKNCGGEKMKWMEWSSVQQGAGLPIAR